jgi:chemotaxis protein CheZ
VRVLKEIETRVEHLVQAFGADTDADAADNGRAKGPVTDEDLLNGPQLPEKAADQAEIDRLLASFD